MVTKKEVVPTIDKIYPFKGLDIQKDRHMEYEHQQPPRKYSMLQETALIGIEIEVENIREAVPITHYWNSKEDNSLRHFGVEFTSIPLRAKQVEYAMNHLYENLYKYNDPAFSPRTSVHVHLNVRDMTWEQIKTFVLLYSIFERHFFLIAGSAREKSIFCVPLYKSGQLYDLPHLEQRHRNWSKYNALNCGTIVGNDQGCPAFGTIEFRHLYGTANTETIVDWVNNILCLRQAAIQYTYQDAFALLIRANSTSEYLTIYKKIFGVYARITEMQKADFETCITRTKLALWATECYKKFLMSAKSVYNDVLNNAKSSTGIDVLKKAKIATWGNGAFNWAELGQALTADQPPAPQPPQEGNW